MIARTGHRRESDTLLQRPMAVIPEHRARPVGAAGFISGKEEFILHPQGAICSRSAGRHQQDAVSKCGSAHFIPFSGRWLQEHAATYGLKLRRVERAVPLVREAD